MSKYQELIFTIGLINMATPIKIIHTDNCLIISAKKKRYPHYDTDIYMEIYSPRIKMSYDRIDGAIKFLRRFYLSLL